MPSRAVFVGLPEENALQCCQADDRRVSFGRIAIVATVGSPNRISPVPPAPAGDSNDFLYSWKEMAVFLKCGVRTVQRWEKDEGLPVHRHRHWKRGTVYALKTEIQDWLKSRESGKTKHLPPPKLLDAVNGSSPILDNTRLYALCEQARERAALARQRLSRIAERQAPPQNALRK